MDAKKPPVTIKPKSVKPYLTDSGTIVPGHQERYRTLDKNPSPKISSEQQAHQAKHKVADKLPGSEMAPKAETITNHTTPTAPTQEPGTGTFENPLQINLNHEPYTVSSAKDPNTPHHTSLVYAIPDDHGRTGFFKPTAGEAWKDVDQLGRVTLYRETMTKDRLGKKEVLTSDLADAIGLESIPKTQWAKVGYSNAKGDKVGLDGSIQMDAHEVLNQHGYTEEQMSYHDAGIHDYDKWSRERIEMSMVDFEHSRKASALKNGGMDLAFFDFITGNADRHGNNFFVGTNPETKERKFIGIDHGLSFPASNDLFFPDYASSLRGVWNCASEHGIDVDCSEKFKSAILSGGTHKKFGDILSKSALNDAEKEGVMHRLQIVKNKLSESGQLTGRVLKDTLKEHMYGTDASGDKWDVPETFSNKGVIYGSPEQSKSSPGNKFATVRPRSVKLDLGSMFT